MLRKKPLARIFGIIAKVSPIYRRCSHLDTGNVNIEILVKNRFLATKIRHKIKKYKLLATLFDCCFIASLFIIAYAAVCQ